VRIQLKNDVNQQQGLFSAEAEAEVGFEGRVGAEEVQRCWISRLSNSPKPCGEAMIASMLEDTGWLLSDFERGISQLLAAGRVKNVDARGKRTKRPVHFDQDERLVLVAE
jgi:hypothetical protein